MDSESGVPYDSSESGSVGGVQYKNLTHRVTEDDANAGIATAVNTETPTEREEQQIDETTIVTAIVDEGLPQCAKRSS